MQNRKKAHESADLPSPPYSVCSGSALFHCHMFPTPGLLGRAQHTRHTLFLSLSFCQHISVCKRKYEPTDDCGGINSMQFILNGFGVTLYTRKASLQNLKDLLGMGRCHYYNGVTWRLLMNTASAVIWVALNWIMWMLGPRWSLLQICIEY